MATVANKDGGDVAGDTKVTDYPLTKHNTTYAGDPQGNLTPTFVGEICLDITNGAYYRATTAANTGWVPTVVAS